MTEEMWKLFNDTFEAEINAQEFAIDEAEWAGLLKALKKAEDAVSGLVGAEPLANTSTADKPQETPTSHTKVRADLGQKLGQFRAKPTGLDLESILNDAFNYWLGERKDLLDREPLIRYAEQALTRWGMEQREEAIKELLSHAREHTITDIEMIMHRSGGKVDFIEAVTTEHFERALSELQANLQDGGE